jgi:transposase
MVYMKPYPIELRQRVLSAVDAGSATREQIAKTFQVSTAWVRRLLQRRRIEGTIAPRGHGGGRRPAFDGPLLAELDRVVQRRPDVTLEALQAHFADRVNCSIVAIHNALRRLDYRFKKNRYERVSKTGPT